MKRFLAITLLCQFATLHSLHADPAQAQNAGVVTQRNAPASVHPQLKQPPVGSRTAIIDLLNEPLDMNKFHNPMILKEACGLISESFDSKQKTVHILIDGDAYRWHSPDLVEDMAEIPIRLAGSPRFLPTLRVLQLIVQKIPIKSVYLIRNGVIEIVPAECATMARLLDAPVVANFKSTSLEVALTRLSEFHAVSINTDPRIREHLQTTINAKFRNDVTLRGTLDTLADFASVDWVVMAGGGVFVTTPENAASLRKRQAEIEKQQRNDAKTTKEKIQQKSK